MWSLLLFLFLVSSLQAQSWASRYEAHNLWANVAIDKELIQKLVQDFTVQKQGEAFRFLGDTEDFFHGHLLFADREYISEDDRLSPFAVLYHTQEEASSHHRKNPGSKYDYLNRYTRSWVQFASEVQENGPILNAFELMFDFFPDTEDYRNGLSATQSHYTVYSDQLDSKKFPQNYQKKILGNLQLNFYECSTPDAELTRKLMWLDAGEIFIYEPLTHKQTCLQLRLGTPYTPEKSFDPEGDFVPLKNEARPKDWKDKKPDFFTYTQ